MGVGTIGGGGEGEVWRTTGGDGALHRGKRWHQTAAFKWPVLAITTAPSTCAHLGTQKVADGGLSGPLHTALVALAAKAKQAEGLQWPAGKTNSLCRA